MAKWVYFVQGGQRRLIKIGFTGHHPEQRYISLMAGSPVPLTKLGVMLGDRYLERRLHEQFVHLRQHAEWFLPGDDLLAFIKAKSRPWPECSEQPQGPEHWRRVLERKRRNDPDRDFRIDDPETWSAQFRDFIARARNNPLLPLMEI